MDYEKNNKEVVPFEHYLELFKDIDPIEASKRCAVDYDENAKEFKLRLMQRQHSLEFPTAIVKDENGDVVDNYQIRIFLMRFLIEAKYVPSTGELLNYRQIPWGDVYFKPFEGRCLMRLAFGFGFSLDKFNRSMEKMGAIKMNMGDSSYRFEFINNYFVVFILWAPDDEFPPSANILFEDNFAQIYRAEDLAVVGDISINELKAISKTL